MRVLELVKNFLRRFATKNPPVKRPAADVERGAEAENGSGIVGSNVGTGGASTAEIITAPGVPQRREQCRHRDGSTPGATSASGTSQRLDQCRYCGGKNFIKSGKRVKKYETQQRYFCNDCKRFFVPQIVKGKSFPLKVILDGLSFYNTGYTLVDSCRFLKENYGMDVQDSTLSEWVKEFEPLCRYGRLRSYGLKLFSPAQVIRTAHLYHHQVYDFSVHRAKLALLLQEYRNNKFDNLREFLEAIQHECPHQFFKDGLRASELKVDFSLDEVIIREKQNFATRLAKLLLQAVSDNKSRHRCLQDFMLRNDSVTVAVEVPVYMDETDIEHMERELGFKIPINFGAGSSSTPAATSARVITGHIDALQLRNGAIHILDYKPQDRDKRRIKPITQLTLYALALSRLTGLRLYDFKCAWFDENVYYEFFPLHVVYKLRERARKEDPGQIKLELEENGEEKAHAL